MTNPKVAIVIVNWNGISDTVECIESLMKIEYSDFNVIVVDNGSSNNDADKLKEKFSKIRVIALKRNLGFAIANNVGIRIALNAGADYVLLLNNDTIVDKKFLTELVKIAQNNSRIGILGSKQYFYDDKKRIWYAGGKLNMLFTHKSIGVRKLDSGQYERTEETDFVIGACMLVRKSVFESIGLLPREYFLGWEDIDFCIAAKKNKYTCMFVPSSIIWHKVSASYTRHNLGHKQVFYGFRNRVIMRHKFLPRSKFVLFILIHFFLVMPVHVVYYILVYKDPKRIKSMCQGFISGIRERGINKIKFNLD